MLVRFSLFAVIFFTLLLTVHSYIYAADYANCNNTVSEQFKSLCKIDATDNMTLARNVTQGLLVIATVAALIFLVYGGVKWVTSGGDKTKITEARGILTASIIGLIVTFFSFFIIIILTSIFGIDGGTIFVLPRLINEKPSRPINTEDHSGGSSGTGSASDGPAITN